MDGVKKFANNNTFRMKEEGEQLQKEANAQAKFGRSMAKLAKMLPWGTYKLKTANSSLST